MSQTFPIPAAPDEQKKVIFPERCVNCGAPQETESKLLVNTLVTQGSQQKQLSWQLAVPHCDNCARSSKAVFMASFVPFILGLVLVGGAVFVIVTFYTSYLGLDDYGQPGTWNSAIAGAAAGLLLGLVAAFLFEGVARLLLRPFYGPALQQAPMLAKQMLQDADYVAGLLAKPDGPHKQLWLTFYNDEVGREFGRLNEALLNQRR